MKKIQIILLAIVFTIPAYAQQIYLPLIPIEIEYEYAPQYISQWIKHPQYSMIEAIFDPKETENLQVILTETESFRRVFYTNSKGQAEYLKAMGKESYLTNIDFKQTHEVGQQPTFGFAFADKAGEPILWRANSATEPSERGAGLTALPAAKGLKLIYRNSGTAVGEGTAVQIGKDVVEAELWKEISSPPYFVAFRGAVTVGLHSGTFLLGEEKWTLREKPENLEKGKKWILLNGSGRLRTLEISSFKPHEIVLDEINPKFNGASSLRLVLQTTPQGYALRNFNLQSHAQEMNIEFAPALPLSVAESGSFESDFVIHQGNHKKVVTGKIVGVREKHSYTKLNWQFNTPDWTKKKKLESIIKFMENGYSIETKEVSQ